MTTPSKNKTALYFGEGFPRLEQLVEKQKTIIITDANVAGLHAEKLEGWKVITLLPGEEHKRQATVDKVIEDLIRLQADRESFIIGLGGGVVTDIAGYAAAIYMRGIRFGFVPTTILAMVDAAIGGKNGVDVGVYKNLVGTVHHPGLLLYDYSFLQTLPREQWINGFAEIIKHACIQDAGMFERLEKHTLDDFMNDPAALAELIKRNVSIKSRIVEADEFETGERKLLNFGHTLGHAIENIYELPHGSAVSIGMVAACRISEELNHFPATETQKLVDVLQRYQLPVQLEWNSDKIWDVLVMDKKRSGTTMNFVLLNKIGEGIIRPIPLEDLKKLLTPAG